MERLGVLNCFRDIFDSEQIGLNKRSGAIYQWVCEHYDVAQKDTIIFEDAIYAVKAAKETDCYVYGMKILPIARCGMKFVKWQMILFVNIPTVIKESGFLMSKIKSGRHCATDIFFG